MSPQVIVGIIALVIALSSMAVGFLGFLVNIAVIVWKGGQIVQATLDMKSTLDEHRKESSKRWDAYDGAIAEARHLAKDAQHKVELLAKEIDANGRMRAPRARGR